MRVFVVLVHPDPDSFNAALCGSMARGLHEAGHDVDVADLYREGFDPLLHAGELAALGSNHPMPDVASYQERILAARALAFVFPVWWFGPPAMLKGFVERVFQENFAFRFTTAGMVQGMLLHEKALIVNTTGASAAMYRLFGFGKPLEKTFDEWTLKFCGIRQVRRLILHDVVAADHATRMRYLAQVRLLGRDYFL